MPKSIASDLPHNSDAEKAVLGGVLVYKKSLYTVLSSLEENDFYESKNQTIYRAFLNLEKKHVDVDCVTVTEELTNMKELENVGGVDYLRQCSDKMIAISALPEYINIVKNQSVLRTMLMKIREIDNDYRTTEIDDVDGFIQKAELLFKEATEKRRVSSFRSSEEVATEVAMKMSNQKKADANGCTGLSSGFSNIDKLTNGFQPSEVTIVAARPSVGKTALALNFAFRAAVRNNVPVAIFSLEMASESLFKRLVAAQSDITLNKIVTGTYNDYEKTKIEEAIRVLGSAPIYIDETPSIKLMDLVVKSRQLQSKVPNLGLIIVDYLGLIETGSKAKGDDSRQEQVRKISLTLKALARDLKVPVVVVSQLSRDVEKRDSKRPMMSDLRDSGNIEQDADVVMLLFRKDYYKNTDAPNANLGKQKFKSMSTSDKFEMIKQSGNGASPNLPGDASYVEVNVAKNRNGQTGLAGLFFYKAFGRFEVPPKEFEEEMRNIESGLME